MSSIDSIKIAGRAIGPDHPPYVIAELSGNHNGELDRAVAIVEAAKEAGADAVKLQTYTADTMTIDHDGPGFRIDSGLWRDRTLFDLYKEAHTPWDWHPALFEKGKEIGIAVFSSPFDSTAVDFLEELGSPAYKIASFEAVDHDLIKKAAATSKPVIISTGMANKHEISSSLEVARRAGNDEIALMHCVSGYPTPPKEYNLRTIPDLAAWSKTVVGLSDHTLGTAVSIAAVTIGANLVEKHLTLARSDGGVDAAFSLEPAELGELVRGCRDAYDALGNASYHRQASERENVIFRRSLYVTEDMKIGDRFTRNNVRAIRPGYGLPPKHLTDILGRCAVRSIRRGEPLHFDMIA